MSAPVDALLLEAAALLPRLPTEPTRLVEARALVAELARRHGTGSVRLVATPTPGRGAVEYDLHVRRPDGTIGLTWAPREDVPGYLAFAEHWANSLVVSVNQTSLTVHNVLQQLRVEAADAPDLMRMLLREAAVADLGEELVDLGEPSDRDVQAAADDFRRSQGLFAVEAMDRWLAERGLGVTQFTAMVRETVLRRRLRQRAVGDEARSLIAEAPAIADTVTLFEVVLTDEMAARRLLDESARGGLLAAFGHLAADLGVAMHGARTTKAVAAALGEPHASGGAGSRSGPRERDGAWVVCETIARAPASDPADAQAAVEEVLLDRRLDAHLARATVTWHWLG